MSGAGFSFAQLAELANSAASQAGDVDTKKSARELAAAVGMPPPAAPPAEQGPGRPSPEDFERIDKASNCASERELTVEVNRCKTLLEDAGAQIPDKIAALQALRKLGNMPVKVLTDTMIGKAVNAIAKSATDKTMKAKAKELVEDWRQTHRKRKSGAGAADEEPSLKRGLSSSLSLGGSEAPGADGLPASQDSSPGGIPRMDSLASLGGDSADKEVEGYRTKVRQKLVEALGKEEEIEAKDGKDGMEERMRDPVTLAMELDEALHAALPQKERYLAQARSILYNLKDKTNHTFRFKLMVGFYRPERVPTLNAEDMASDEKNAERARQRKFAMEEIQSDWALKNGQQRISGMFTCGKCKGTRTTYFQMQTRSSDEPMTTFVTCLTCNNRWKFC